MAFDRMLWRVRLACGVAACLGGLGGSACGPMTSAVDIRAVEHLLSSARAHNAGLFAPYDLYFAEAQLDKANEEAAQGHYEDALRALRAARLHGQRALSVSTQAPGISSR